MEEWIRGNTKSNLSKWNINKKNTTSTNMFNNLKCKTKAQIKATAIEETENKEKPTYAEILRKSWNPSSRQNLRTNLESQIKPNIHERLWSMSPTNKRQKQGKSLHEPFLKQATLTTITTTKNKLTQRRNKEVENNVKYNSRNYKHRSGKNEQSPTTKFKEQMWHLQRMEAF